MQKTDYVIQREVLKEEASNLNAILNILQEGSVLYFTE